MGIEKETRTKEGNENECEINIDISTWNIKDVIKGEWNKLVLGKVAENKKNKRTEKQNIDKCAINIYKHMKYQGRNKKSLE